MDNLAKSCPFIAKVTKSSDYLRSMPSSFRFRLMGELIPACSTEPADVVLHSVKLLFLVRKRQVSRVKTENHITFELVN